LNEVSTESKCGFSKLALLYALINNTVQMLSPALVAHEFVLG
jgi:hypothetical protein